MSPASLSSAPNDKVSEVPWTSGEDNVSTPTLPGLPVYGKNRFRKRTPDLLMPTNYYNQDMVLILLRVFINLFVLITIRSLKFILIIMKYYITWVIINPHNKYSLTATIRMFWKVMLTPALREVVIWFTSTKVCLTRPFLTQKGPKTPRIILT